MWHLRWIANLGWRLFHGPGNDWHRHHRHHHHHHHPATLIVPDAHKPARFG